MQPPFIRKQHALLVPSPVQRRLELPGGDQLLACTRTEGIDILTVATALPIAFERLERHQEDARLKVHAALVRAAGLRHAGE